LEKATVGTVHSEDWGIFNRICDIINTTEDGPKDAVKALKKRISGNCNHKEIRFALSLLDFCMNNCDPCFQSLVVKKEFAKDVLVKVLKPKYNPPVDVQNKILNFIETWANGVQRVVDVSEVKEIYMDMKKKGIVFPPSDFAVEKQSNCPLRTVPTEDLSLKEPCLLPSLTSTVAAFPATHETLVTLTPIQVKNLQIGKLYSELDIVKMNISVMSAILIENTPAAENPDDMELLEKLHNTCQAMQERIRKLLNDVANEDVTHVLLQVNDDLNNVFLRYNRY
uniref:Target of myb1 like 1 membrane trafficking protein n=1 Tax=Latimeria chalumnae TaxID=7897 RepID=H3B2X5_LATCH